jgi:NmrA-like family
VKALLEPSSDGAPSPYTVRILTRNPDHPQVKAEFNHPNIELVQGSFTDLAKVERALEGVWGAYVNTDGFTVGEQAETYYGLRIFELAAPVPTLKHYVWSNLDYGLKKGGYRAEYHCGHYDGQGRIGDWLTTKPFSTQVDEFKWTVFTNGLYAEMLYGANSCPRFSTMARASLRHPSAMDMSQLSPCQTSATSPATFSIIPPTPLVGISR